MTITNLTSGVNSGSSTNGTTASVSPGANRLLIVSIFTGSGAGWASPTMSGLSLTWTKRVEQVDSDTQRAVTIYTAPTGASPGSGTISMTQSVATTMLWCVDEVSGDIDTANPVVQTASNKIDNASASTITVTLGTFASSANATYGAIRISTNNPLTVGSGFTQLAQPAATNPFYAQSQWKNSNDTTVDWSWSSNTVRVQACAMELRAVSGAPWEQTMLRVGR